MLFAFMRKFSQVREQWMLSLLGLYFWRNQTVSLLLTLPFMFSVTDWLFSFLFSLFFSWLSVVHGSLASCAASKMALKTNPKQFQGVVTMGISQRKAASPISPSTWVQGREGPVLETHLSVKHFPIGAHLLFSFPWHSHFPHCHLPRGKNGPSFPRKTSVEYSIQCENG